MQRLAGGAGIGGVANKRPPPTAGAGGSVKIANIAASKKVAGSPFLECVPGTRVIYSRRVPGRDGSDRMALFEAKVVQTAGSRVDGDRHTIKLDGDDGGGAWWEPTMNLYDIVVPPRTDAVAGPPCDGIRRIHLVEGSRDEFDRRCEAARLEVGRLGQDATRIADDRRVCLGSPAGTAGVVGLLSHGVPPAQQHYQLRSLDSRPANDIELFMSAVVGANHAQAALM